MRVNNRKLAVLAKLNEKTRPVSLEELIGELGEGCPERTVRRWLAEMVKEGLVEKTGNKRSTKYQLAEMPEFRGGSFREGKAEDLVKKPLYARLPVAYSEDWFDAYIPNESFYIPFELRQQLYKAGQRTKSEASAGSHARLIFERLLVDLSYNSCRLEGNAYSLLETKKLLLEGAGAAGKLDEETVMILNHKEAILYLVDTAPRLEITKETICTLHLLLSDGLIEPCYTGKVRNHGVRIGGSVYIPFEDARRLQRQLEKIADKGALIEDPYEQSFFLLVHIMYLQAFADVNKRTARLSANISLIKGNLVPLSFNDVDKEAYTSAVITIYELQDVKPLLDLYVFSYMRTCHMYDLTIKIVGVDEVRVRYRKERREALREIITNCMLGEKLREYIESQALQLVKEDDRKAFIENVREDLKELDEAYIVGLGITREDLRKYLNIAR